MRMKRVLEKMEPLLLDMAESGKEGTRMELFERSGLANWAEFKRLFSLLQSHNMMMGRIPRDAKEIKPGKIPWTLSRHGRKVVQEFCG
jgi:hypothetical protein